MMELLRALGKGLGLQKRSALKSSCTALSFSVAPCTTPRRNGRLTLLVRMEQGIEQNILERPLSSVPCVLSSTTVAADATSASGGQTGGRAGAAPDGQQHP
jgi:hypothetical protein